MPPTDDFENQQTGSLETPQTEGAETPKAGEKKPDGVQMSKKAVIIWSLLGLLLLVILGSAVYEHFIVDVIFGRKDPDKKVLMPHIDFENYAGDEFCIEDFLGKPMVINFWATWCPNCVKEMPLFDRYVGQYGDRIQFLFIDFIDMGGEETKEDGLNFFQDKGYATDLLYFDTAYQLIDVYKQLGGSGNIPLPVTVFVDAEGYITWGLAGQINEITLLAKILELLASPEEGNGEE